MSQNKRGAEGDLLPLNQDSLKKGNFDDLSLQLENRYDESADGPFMVLLKDKREGENLGNIHPMVIGKKFKQCGLDVVNIDRYSEDRILALFNEAVEANEFVENTINLINKEWLAYIPDFAIQHIGIVRDVPVEITANEILEVVREGSNKNNIIEVVRNKEKKVTTKIIDGFERNIEELVESDSIKIVFNNKLPDSVKIYCCIRKVLKFIPAVRRCYNFQKYGHTANRCKGGFRCSNCGKEHDRNIACKSDTKCINCEGKHQSSDKCCPCFKFHREVNKIKTFSNLRHNEAVEIVKNRYVHKILNGSNDSFEDASIPNLAKTLNLGIAVISCNIENIRSEKKIEKSNNVKSKDILEFAAVKTYSDNIDGFLVDRYGENSEVLKEFRKINKEMGLINVEE